MMIKLLITNRFVKPPYGWSCLNLVLHYTLMFAFFFSSKERLRSTVLDWKDKPVVLSLVDAIQNFYPFPVGRLVTGWFHV